jgi:hypothetical protein
MMGAEQSLNSATHRSSHGDYGRDTEKGRLTDSMWLAATLGLYASMSWLTKPLDYGDTIFYVKDILNAGKQFKLSALRPLLDFGHLLWRPLGWLLFCVTHATASFNPDQERLAATKILISISTLSGAIATVFLYLICRNLKFGQRVSFVVCSTFVCCNSVVYAASIGSSYMLSLAFLMAALWLVMLRPRAEAKVYNRDLWCVGLLLSLSAAAWFPFVLVVPAVAAAAAIRVDDPGWSMRDFQLARGFRVIAANIVGNITVFGIAVVALGISSFSGVMAWIKGSAHGWRQSSNLLRLGMGLPRCCVAVTNDAGVVWKRFFFRDPFAPARLRDLVQFNLVWIIAFYFGLVLLLYTLSRNRRGRVFLAILIIAAAPMLVFAVFLFEPSSIERFMPVFPFYFIALGYQLCLTWPKPMERSLGLVYPAVLIFSTVAIYNNNSVERHWAPAQVRLQTLKEQLPSGSTVSLLGNWDDIFLFAKDNPLRDTFSDSLDLWVVLRPANDRIFCWRELFVSRVFEAWGRSSEIWISERLLAPVPLPEWGWVEGDDRAIRWNQVPEFFRRFQFDKKIGASDGFVRVAHSEANRVLLDSLAAQPCKYKNLSLSATVSSSNLTSSENAGP